MQWKKVVASAVALVITAGYLPQSGYMEDNVQRDVGIAPIVSDGEQDIRGQLEKLGVAVTETDEAQEQAPAGAVAAPETAAAVLPAFTFTVPSTVPNTVPAAVEDVQPVPQAATPVLPTGTYQAPSRVLQYQPGRYSAYGTMVVSSNKITDSYGSGSGIIELSSPGEYEIESGTKVTRAIKISATGVTLTINGTLDTSENTNVRVKNSPPLNVTASGEQIVIINANAKVKGPAGKAILSGSKEAFDIKADSYFDQDPAAYLGEGLEAVKQPDGWWKVQTAGNPDEKAFKNAQQAALQEIEREIEKYTSDPYDQSNADVIALTDKYFEAYDAIEKMTYSAEVTTEKTVNEKLEALREEVKDLKNKPGILIPELIAEINATLLPANDSDAQQIKKLALEKLDDLRDNGGTTENVNQVKTGFSTHITNIEALNKAKTEMTEALGKLLDGVKSEYTNDTTAATDVTNAVNAINAIKYLQDGANSWEDLATKTNNDQTVYDTAKEKAAEIAWTVIEKLKGDDKGNHDFGINSVEDLKKLETVAKVKAKLDETCAKAPLFEKQDDANTQIDAWLSGLKDKSENAYTKYPTLKSRVDYWKNLVKKATNVGAIETYMSMAEGDIGQQIEAANTLYDAKVQAKEDIDAILDKTEYAAKPEFKNLVNDYMSGDDLDDYKKKVDEATTVDGVNAQVTNAERAVKDAFAAYNLDDAKQTAKNELDGLVGKDEYSSYKSQLEEILKTYINEDKKDGKIDTADSVGAVNLLKEEAKRAIEEKAVELKLASTKENLKRQLSTYEKNKYGEDATAKGIVEDYTGRIEKASTEAEAYNYFNDAKKAIDQRVEALEVEQNRETQQEAISTYASEQYKKYGLTVTQAANDVVNQWKGLVATATTTASMEKLVEQAKAALDARLLADLKADAIDQLNAYAVGKTYAAESPNEDGTSNARRTDIVDDLDLAGDINRVSKPAEIASAIAAAKAEMDEWRLYTLTITFEGVSQAEVTKTYKAGTMAEYMAPDIEGMKFSNWKEDNKDVHGYKGISVKMSGNRTLTAVYGQTEYVNPTGNTLKLTATVKDNVITFTADRAFYDSAVEQFGILYSSKTSDLKFEDTEGDGSQLDDPTFEKDGKKVTHKYRVEDTEIGVFSVKLQNPNTGESTNMYACAYVVLTDGTVKYTSVLTVTKEGDSWTQPTSNEVTLAD